MADQRAPLGAHSREAPAGRRLASARHGQVLRPSAASTPSSTSASAGGSCSRAARSTAAPGRRGTTARSASSSRRTSSASGGAPWSRAATTSSASTPRSSCRARSGWPPATSRRSADPLVECQTATSGSAPTTSRRRRREGARARVDPDTIPLADDRVPELRHPRPVDRAARVQRPAQDLPRPGRGRVRPALPAARDRAGHLRELPERRCSRRARKPPFGIGQIGKSFRNEITPGQLHLPHPRVRADGDGVLRQAGHGRGVAPVLDRRRAPTGTSASASTREQPAALRAPEGEAVALLQAHRRHRVPLRLHRLGVGRARGHRQPHRLRPDDALAALGRRPVVLRPGHRRALHAVRHRAGGRPRPAR